jgi:hypothetical protein
VGHRLAYALCAAGDKCFLPLQDSRIKRHALPRH